MTPDLESAARALLAYLDTILPGPRLTALGDALRAALAESKAAPAERGEPWGWGCELIDGVGNVLKECVVWESENEALLGIERSPPDAGLKARIIPLYRPPVEAPKGEAGEMLRDDAGALLRAVHEWTEVCDGPPRPEETGRQWHDRMKERWAPIPLAITNLRRTLQEGTSCAPPGDDAELRRLLDRANDALSLAPGHREECGEHRMNGCDCGYGPFADAFEALEMAINRRTTPTSPTPGETKGTT